MTVRTLPGQQVGGMLFGRRVNIERNDQGKVRGFDTSDDCYEPLLVEWQSMPHRTVGVPYDEVEIVPPAAGGSTPQAAVAAGLVPNVVVANTETVVRSLGGVKEEISAMREAVGGTAKALKEVIEESKANFTAVVQGQGSGGEGGAEAGQPSTATTTPSGNTSLSLSRGFVLSGRHPSIILYCTFTAYLSVKQISSV